jgi:hypothetical protein
MSNDNDGHGRLHTCKVCSSCNKFAPFLLPVSVNRESIAAAIQTQMVLLMGGKGGCQSNQQLTAL